MKKQNSKKLKALNFALIVFFLAWAYILFKNTDTDSVTLVQLFLSMMVCILHTSYSVEKAVSDAHNE